MGAYWERTTSPAFSLETGRRGRYGGGMTTASDMLAAYLAAESAILLGKTIAFQGRTVGYENLAEIRKGRAECERRVAVERNGGAAFGGMSFSVARFDG